MIQKYSVSIGLVLALVACGKGGKEKKVGGAVILPAAVNTGIHGTWGGVPEVTDANGVKFRMRMRLQPTTVSAIGTCENEDTIVHVIVTVPATYAGNNVTTTAGSGREEFNGLVCTARVAAATISVTPNGPNAIVMTDGRSTHTLTRE